MQLITRTNFICTLSRFNALGYNSLLTRNCKSVYVFHKSLFESKLLLLSDSRYWQLLLLSIYWEFLISFLQLIYSKINTWWLYWGITDGRGSDLLHSLSRDQIEPRKKRKHCLENSVYVWVIWLTVWWSTPLLVWEMYTYLRLELSGHLGDWLSESVGVKAALTILSFCLTRMAKVSTRPRHLTQFPQWKVIWQRKSWEHIETEKYKRIIK